MHVDVVGEPWRLDEPPPGLLRRVEALHVAPLLRSDFDAAALERLGSGRRLLLDAQGLVRVPKTGPLTLDADFDPDVLRHVSILKVSEEEADVLAGGDRDALADLGVPEIVLTLGERGSVVIVNGHAEEIPARPVGRRGRPDRRGRCVRERVPLGPRERSRACIGRAAGNRARRGAAAGARAMIAAVQTVEGVLLVDLEDEQVLGDGNELPEADAPGVELPRVVATARSGATIVADRRPAAAARDLARQRLDVDRSRRRSPGRLRGRDRRGRSRPDGLCGAQPALRLGQRRRVLARA